jgi:hypothetical protein
MLPPKDSRESLLSVHRQLQEALYLVSVGAIADGIAVYVSILAAIFHLTEEEADLIEPDVTKLEFELRNWGYPPQDFFRVQYPSAMVFN